MYNHNTYQNVVLATEGHPSWWKVSLKDKKCYFKQTLLLIHLTLFYYQFEQYQNF